MEDFNKIVKLMNDKGVSQSDLADYLGVGRQKVSDWKRGSIKSWLKYIDKIAECLGVSVGECLGVDVETKEKTADPLDGLKIRLLSVMEDLSSEELQKLLDHAELLEAARRKPKGR